MEARRPLVVEVKRGSLEDGPGIRTVVFFKGCPLRCVFCHNPEAQECGPELAFASQRCEECGRCAEACPQAAIDLRSPRRVDRAKCDLCGRCTEVCPAGALRVIGEYWPTERLVELLLRDLPFYHHSRGGVTFSGGECTMFPDYLHAVFRGLKAYPIHVALETSGCFDYNTFARRILPFVDLVLIDVKIMDGAASMRYLGQPSERMLENVRRLLAEPNVEVRPRIPLIPEITAGRENLAAIVNALSAYGADDVTLLSYNPAGLSMYAELGKPMPDLPLEFMNPERERELMHMFGEIIDSALQRQNSIRNGA